MAVSKVVNDFFTLLRKSQLLAQDDLQDAVFTVSQLEDPQAKDIAKALVDERYLTRYQAERLLEGNARGLVIDGYKVLEVLGRGGMGWVYIAQDMETQWRVALKVLPDEARSDPGALARFRLEAQAGIRLDHPNIVRSYRMGAYEDIYGPIHYVAMELVRGVNLFEFMLMKKRLDVGQACDIIMQAAAGLSYAHGKGLVHRDVKPENLLVCSDGSVKILDFGLAMVDENDEEFSMAMIFGQNRLGTADYISPEQYVDSYVVDHRADIYSLGCSFYFALAGRVPFPFDTPGKKLRAHLRKRPTPIEELRPDVPPRVSQIVAKMMAKHPENRIQSAADVERLLRPYAKRQANSINFRSVLTARIAHAKRKAEAPKATQPASTRELPDLPGSGHQSTIETIVREDTMLDQGKRPERGG